MSRFYWKPILLVILVAIRSVLAQESQEGLALAGEWEEEKHAFEIKLAEASLSADRHFSTQLHQFEKEAAKKEDYASAITFREQRRDLRKRLALADPVIRRAREAIAVPLEMHGATLAGSVRFNQGVLRQWTSSKDMASWDLRDLGPGTFEVVVSYSCSSRVKLSENSKGIKIKAHAGGTFTFGRDEMKLTHRVIPTENWEAFREISLGTLKIKKSAPTLSLEVIQVGALNLMHMRSIKLYPLAPALSDDVIKGSTDEIQRGFEGVVARKIQPLSQAHMTALKGLHKEAQSQGDEALAQRIAEAIENLKIQAKFP
ncbi:MAG: hypothetical protein ACKVHP_05910 [Verrucomicrobiales bacterium]